jgi:hypothetical protein
MPSILTNDLPMHMNQTDIPQKRVQTVFLIWSIWDRDGKESIL